MIKIRKKDEILINMLALAKEKMDTSQNSFIHQAEACASIELEKANEDLRLIASKFDFWKLSGAELDEGVFQRTGIVRKEAGKAEGEVTFTGSAGVKIPKGTVVLADDVAFVTLEEGVIESTLVTVPVVALEEGSQGNVKLGTIKELDQEIFGITDVNNAKSLYGGRDMESDEELKERCDRRMKYPPKAGNVYHFEEWVREVPGVYDCKAFRRWQNRATVRVIVVGDDGLPASEELIAKVEDHLKDLVPFGADTLIEPVRQKTIDIEVDLVLEDGEVRKDVVDNIKANLSEYFINAVFRESSLSLARMGCIILNTWGVKDYSNLRVTGDLTLAEDEIPVIGEVS